MFRPNRVAWAGIVLILVTTGISGPRRTMLAPVSNLSEEVSAVGHGNEVKQVQQTLREKGHYRGEIDGVFGLRTRSSIRGFQKAVNLPVTGALDVQTAGKLGVRPEVREETSHEATQEKPTAGITWAEGSRRTGRTLRKPVKKSARTVPPA